MKLKDIINFFFNNYCSFLTSIIYTNFNNKKPRLKYFK